MKCYEKHIEQPWFFWIETGEKTIEGRANHGSFAKIDKGDVVIWSNDCCGKRKYVKTKVITTYTFKNYKIMFENLGLKNILPFKEIKTYKQNR